MLHQNNWRTWTTIGICVLALIYALPNVLPDRVLNALPGFWPKDRLGLGLDLRGGSYLLVAADVRQLKQDWLQSLEGDTRSRLRTAKIGYTGLGRVEDTVRVRITKPEDVDKAIEALKGMIQTSSASQVFGGGGPDLTITQVEPGVVTIAPTDVAVNQRINSGMSSAIEIVRNRIDQLGTKEPVVQRQGLDRIVVQVPGFDDPQKLKQLIGTTAKLAFHGVDLTKSVADAEATGVPPDSKIFDFVEGKQQGGRILLYKTPVVQGDDLVDAQQTFDGRSGEPVVAFRFNTSGAKRFAKYTEENVKRPFAIVLDGKVISAPTIQEPILSGSGQISGSFTVESANDLAIQLRSGALPTSLTVVEERTIGASLGTDSIQSGVFAGIIGSLAVILFMLLVYALFGAFANIAVVIHVVIIIALMTMIGSTLTLPGIAGLVLTVGMAVDANVLIYERIREEIRSGKSAISAIDAGFKRAYATIIDSQVTTLVAAIVMFWLGSGPVKGFAVTLSLGVLTTVFTSVTVTRLLVAWWLQRQKSRKIHVPI